MGGVATYWLRAASLILGIAILHPLANIATCVLACPVMGYSHPVGNIDTDWLTASPMWGHSHPVEKTSPLAHWLTASLLLGIAPEFVPVANIATCLTGLPPATYWDSHPWVTSLLTDWLTASFVLAGHGPPVGGVATLLASCCQPHIGHSHPAPSG